MMTPEKYLTKPIHVENWNKYVMHGIEELFKNQEHCDLTLRFPSRDIKAHSVVLHSCSPFFTSLLKGKTTGHKILKMPPQVNADAMAAIIKFIYTGRLHSTLSVTVLCATASIVKLQALTGLLQSHLPGSRTQTALDSALAVYSSSPQSPAPERLSSGVTGPSPSRNHQPTARQQRIVGVRPRAWCPELADPPEVVRPSRFEFPSDMDLHAISLPTYDSPVTTTPPPRHNVNGKRHAPPAGSDGNALLRVVRARSSHAADGQLLLSTDSAATGSDVRLADNTTLQLLPLEQGAAAACVSPAEQLRGSKPDAAMSEVFHCSGETTQQSVVNSNGQVSEPAVYLQCSLCCSSASGATAETTSFIGAAHMSAHLESTHSDSATVPVCLLCGDAGAPLRFPAVLDYVRHVEDLHVPPSVRLACQVCAYSCRRWLELIYHRYTRHRTAPPAFVAFPRCDRCEFEAMSTGHLTAHRQRRHRLGRQYRCRQCVDAVVFASISQLEGHMRTHHATGRRDLERWKCEFCGMAFSRSYNLKGHMRSVHKVSNVAAEYRCGSIGDQQLPVSQPAGGDGQLFVEPQSVASDFVLPDVSASVIPVHDENGVVSYIALHSTAAGSQQLASGPDGAALLEITTLPQQHGLAQIRHNQQLLESTPVHHNQQLLESTPVHHNQQLLESTPVHHNQQLLESTPVHHDQQQLLESTPVHHDQQQLLDSMPVHHDQQQLLESTPVHHDQQLLQSTPVLHDQQQLLESTPVHHNQQQLLESTPAHHNQQLLESTPIHHDQQQLLKSTPVHHDQQQLLESTPVHHNQQQLLESTPVHHNQQLLESTPIHHNQQQLLESAPVRHDRQQLLESTTVRHERQQLLESTPVHHNQQLLESTPVHQDQQQILDSAPSAVPLPAFSVQQQQEALLAGAGFIVQAADTLGVQHCYTVATAAPDPGEDWTEMVPSMMDGAGATAQPHLA